MKQPLINIKDIHGTDYGKRPVKSITWDVKGNIESLVVVMTGDLVLIPVNDPKRPNTFENGHGYIIGRLLN